MPPRIEKSPERKVIGLRLRMSFADYRIGELWARFMPRRREIGNAVSRDLLSMVIYPAGHFESFRPTNEFERWATVEVSGFDAVPAGMETFTLAAGLYAVFHYRGLNTDPAIYEPRKKRSGFRSAKTRAP